MLKHIVKIAEEELKDVPLLDKWDDQLFYICITEFPNNVVTEAFISGADLNEDQYKVIMAMGHHQDIFTQHLWPDWILSWIYLPKKEFEHIYDTYFNKFDSCNIYPLDREMFGCLHDKEIYGLECHKPAIVVTGSCHPVEPYYEKL